MIDNIQSRIVTFAPLLDGLLVALAGWTAYEIRWGSWSVPQDYLLVIVLGTTLAVVVLPLSGAYQSWRGHSHWHGIGHSIPGLIFVAISLAILGTLTKTTAEFSRLWMAYWFSLTLLTMFVFRWIARNLQRLSRQSTNKKRRILLVGNAEFTAKVAKKIQENSNSTLTVCGFVTTGEATNGATLPGQVMGTIEDLESIASAPGSNIEEVWIAIDTIQPRHLELISRLLQTTCLTIRFVPNLFMLPLLNRAPSEVAGMTVIELNASPLEGHNVIIKSTFDRTFAALALFVLWPLFCIIALAIKLDSPGPVFFRQKRHGWDGSVIHVLKFRTMTHADSLSGESQQAVRNDPRVTSIGRFLRRSSIDELPQFINVLLGSMSVVGPRPQPLALNESYHEKIDAYMQRHRVKPGVTGWAQVHGLRGQTETLGKMKKRVEFDLYYIENWSLWLDIKIILQTLAVVWKDKNAY